MNKLVIASFALLGLFSACNDNTPEKKVVKPPIKTVPPPVKPPVTPPVTPPVVPPVVPPETPPVTPPSTNPLDNLPRDTGGIHKAIVLGADASPYGYYLYTPSGYTSSGPRFPLLIFLHGSGEVGNSSSDPSALDKVLDNGPPRLIERGTWAPKYPMVVASIQCHDGWWDTEKVKEFTEFMMAHYQIDTSRIYMTGLSMGGYGTWDQITKYGKGSHLTAAVPVSGGGTLSTERIRLGSLVPVWAFHGEEDMNVLPDFDIAIRTAINALHPVVPAKLTLYPNTGHNAWSKTYDGTGMGEEDPSYDPFGMEIYSWMFLYSK